MNRIVFGLGRFNPPTRGHEFLIEEVKRVALENNAVPMIYVIDGEKTSLDFEKNPISGAARRKILSSLYNIDVDIAGSAYEVLEIIDVMGLNPIGLVCGSDRTKQYSSMIKYSGFPCKIFPLDRKTGKVASISGTSARNAARFGTFEDFKRHMSPLMPDSLIMQVKNCIIEPGGFIDDIRCHSSDVANNAKIARFRR